MPETSVMPRYVLPGRQGRKGNYQIKVVAGLSVGLHLRLCPFYAYGNRQGAGSERSRTLHPRQICYGNNPTPPHRLYRPPPELSGGRNLVFVPFPTPLLLYFQAQGGGPSCRNPPTSKAAGPDCPLCFFPGHSGCSCPQDVPIHTALFRFFHVRSGRSRSGTPERPRPFIVTRAAIRNAATGPPATIVPERVCRSITPGSARL